MKKFIKKMTIFSASALALTAFAPQVMAQDDAAEEVSGEETSQVEETSAEDSAETDDTTSEESELQALLNEAIDMFLEEFPDAELEEIDVELNRDGGYDIDIHGFDAENEYEAEFRNDPLELVNSETDQEDDDDDDDIALDLENSISIDEASEIALNEAGAGEIRSWHLDEDDRGFYWEISIELEDGNEAEVDIDAATGDVVEVELDD